MHRFFYLCIFFYIFVKLQVIFLQTFTILNLLLLTVDVIDLI